MKAKWGVLGAAKIALKQVIPAMAQADDCEVVAIASRDAARARQAADELGIEKAYGSYDELLADADVNIIYNPLPNNLHVEWSVRSLEAGKHVLCEKPIAMNAVEAQELVAARDRTGLQVQEAFMVRHHPQWLQAREIVRSGDLGEVHAIHGFFSYMNTDAGNIRNRPETGGGAMMDIGCYLVVASRYLLGEDPRSVFATIDRDPEFGTDRLTSAVLDFDGPQATFTCGTQCAPHQRVRALGSRGTLEIEVPFNAPNDRETRLFVDDCRDLFGSGLRIESIPICNQYTLQADAFSRAVVNDEALEFPLEDAVTNMTIIDAIFASAERGVPVVTAG